MHDYDIRIYCFSNFLKEHVSWWCFIFFSFYFWAFHFLNAWVGIPWNTQGRGHFSSDFTYRRISLWDRWTSHAIGVFILWMNDQKGTRKRGHAMLCVFQLLKDEDHQPTQPGFSLLSSRLVQAYWPWGFRDELTFSNKFSRTSYRDGLWWSRIR